MGGASYSYLVVIVQLPAVGSKGHSRRHLALQNPPANDSRSLPSASSARPSSSHCIVKQLSVQHLFAGPLFAPILQPASGSLEHAHQVSALNHMTVASTLGLGQTILRMPVREFLCPYFLAFLVLASVWSSSPDIRHVSFLFVARSPRAVSSHSSPLM